MPEVGLGIGRCQTVFGGIQQEILSWYDQQNKRYLTAEEKNQQLAEYLRSLGVDPDNLPCS
jgi:hypothetical protein